MLLDNDLEYVKGEGYAFGVALSWVLDNEVVYTLAVNSDIADMFLNSDVSDVSIEYPEHNGVSVKFSMTDGQEEILQTSEYFGSILLSNPVVINLLSHKHGTVILGKGEQFLNNEFAIPNVDMSTIQEWGLGYGPESGRHEAMCLSYCQCNKLK
jgi:hypothetical protein